jgi:HK97 family phage major capsid protein
MSEHLKRKIEEQNKTYARMLEIQEVAETESRDWTAEERTNWDAANTKLDEVSADIERLQAAEARDSVDFGQVLRTGDVGATGAELTDEQRDAQEQAQYDRAFDGYVRGGVETLDMEHRQLLAANFVAGTETRAQATSPGSSGGYLIPPGYRQIIIERMKAYGGLLSYATVINTSTGNQLQWPTNDDTGNVGSILAENTGASTVNFTFGTANLGAYMYNSGIVLASLQVLQDSVFPLDTWLPSHLGIRIARKVAADLVNGTGSSQPLGILTNAPVTTTGTGVSGISYDNLIDLEHSLDPAYRSNCRFMMNDATLAVIRKIKDTQGHPLWVPVPVPGMAPTINGQPYFIDQAMPAPGASAKSILFGNYAEAYVVRQVLDMNMVRFGERYMDALQVGFLAFTRLDGTLQNSNALAAFQHAAS